MFASAVRAAVSEVPVGALEHALAAGSFSQAEGAVEAAFEALEAGLRGGTPTARGITAAAAAGSTAAVSDVLADALNGGAASSAVCVKAPGKDAQLDALQDYAAGGETNQLLRAGRGVEALPKSDRQIVEGLDALMAENATPEKIRVFRVAEMRPEWADLKAGDQITDRGFISTTKSRDAIPDLLEALDVQGEDYVLFNINVPPGTPSVDVNKLLKGDRNFFPEQRELLLARGRTFEVDGTKVMPDGHLQVFMRLVR